MLPKYIQTQFPITVSFYSMMKRAFCRQLGCGKENLQMLPETKASMMVLEQ